MYQKNATDLGRCHKASTDFFVDLSSTCASPGPALQISLGYCPPPPFLSSKLKWRELPTWLPHQTRGNRENTCWEFARTTCFQETGPHSVCIQISRCGLACLVNEVLMIMSRATSSEAGTVQDEPSDPEGDQKSVRVPILVLSLTSGRVLESCRKDRTY